MKYATVVVLACLSVPALAQLSGKPAGLETRQIAAMEEMGGLVAKDAPNPYAKSLTIVDKRTKKDDLPAQFAERMKMVFRINIRVGEPRADDAVVELCNIGTESVVYPDKAFARIPTGKDDVETRKQLHAGLMYVLGVKGANISPISVKTVIMNAADLGIPKITLKPYKIACEEGWAPAPTNDIQKAIWEKVKAEKEAAAKPAEATEAK